MMLRCFVLAGFAVALGLAGCKGESSNAPDSSVSDGPAASDASRNDVGQDSAVAANTDGAAAAPDQPVARDASDRDAATDRLAADVVLAADGPAAETPSADKPAADGPAAETRAADRPAAEVSAADKPEAEAPIADGPLPEAPVADRPGGDASSDGGCTGWTTLQRISPAEAADLIATANPIVINVHIPYAGDIPGTDTDIPYNNVQAIDAYLNGDHCADILLVCLSGSMSQTAGNDLIKLGYLRVRDLNGGMNAWVAAGYTLLKDGGT
jgi:rhodanese-related sulfurtransferase